LKRVVEVEGAHGTRGQRGQSARFQLAIGDATTAVPPPQQQRAEIGNCRIFRVAMVKEQQGLFGLGDTGFLKRIIVVCSLARRVGSCPKQSFTIRARKGRYTIASVACGNETQSIFVITLYFFLPIG
jgi:hypothetical protein